MEKEGVMGLTSLKQQGFPCGFYCKEFRYEANMSSLPKDCGTCYFLSFGSCSKGNIPKIKGEYKE